MPTLRQIVAAQAAAAEELPLVHTTRCEVLPHIVANSELRSVNKCKVFDEHLIYFFYGRPAFKHETGDEPAAVIESLSRLFCFQTPNGCNALKRILRVRYRSNSVGIFETAFPRRP